MPSIQYGSGAYKRSFGNFPPLQLINMYLEKADTSENQVALVSRSGLGLLATNGSGPINGMFSKQGTFSGDVFTISGTALYRGTSAVSSGTIAGSGVASFAGSSDELLITRGTVMRSYKAAGIANVTFPDSANVRAVCFIGSLFVAIRGDGTLPGSFYWSDLLDGRTWDGLNFATAEREPDDLLDLAPLGDNLWLFGQQTIEAWVHSGDADLPFTRIENVAFDKGIYSTGCVTAADNSLIFVGQDCVVYRIADTPVRISDHWLEEQIRAASSAILFSHRREGHEFVTLRLDGTDGATYEYDCATQEWHENQTSEGQWIACNAAMVGEVAYFGHQSTGEIMGWSEWDDMGAELERRFSAALQLDSPLSIDRLSLWANTGQSTVLSGQGSAPVIEARYSRDAGNTFTDWDDAGLGNAALGGSGQYRVVPEWRRLGQYDFPGFLAEFRCTDPVPLRISAVKVNDPGGGRSRV